MNSSLALRPACLEDEAFLAQLYASTRADELAALPWSEAQKTAFVEMQFRAQHGYYHEHDPEASYDVVVLDGQSIGRIYVDRAEDGLILMEITLLPEYRNQGIGTGLIEAVLDEAVTAGIPVNLHVEPWNPALRLYERLGFRKVAEHGLYWFMGWTPPAGGG